MTFEEWFKQPREYNLEVYDVAEEAWDAATEQVNKKHELTFQALENALMYKEGTAFNDWAIEHYIATKAVQESE